MIEESVSIWASMNSWFTPTVLFVLLNLMIVTIAITSRVATHKPSNSLDQHQQPHDKQHTHHHYQHQHQLARSPSMLQRLKSINFYNYRSQEPTTMTFEKPAQESESHFSTLQQTPPHQQQEEYYYNHRQPHEQQPPLSRSPSVLQRLRSINLYNYFSPEPGTTNTTTTTTTTASTFLKSEETTARYSPQRISFDQKMEEAAAEAEELPLEHGQEQEEEEDNDEIQDQEETIEEIYSRLKGHKVSRSKSDTKPTAGEVPQKLPKKMKKSASAKSAFAHFKEDDIAEVEARRPATVRERKVSAEVNADDEVDAKADDFINRFKQQLKLQRIDSIMRYKEMINGGSTGR